MTATISADFPFGPHFVEVFGSKPRLAARALHRSRFDRDGQVGQTQTRLPIPRPCTIPRRVHRGARPEEHYAGRPRLGLGSRLPLRLLARCALLARRAHSEF